MITPRTTRLVRAANLHDYRHALAEFSGEGDPIDVLDRLLVVPTHAAAALLMAYRERLHTPTGAALHPTFATARELPGRLVERASPSMQQVLPEAREVLMGVASRLASESGTAPPFELRPGLVAEMLHLYDALMRRRRDIEAFERLTLGRLEPGAEYDRGAERLVRQTQFLVSAFTTFEQLCREQAFDDEHALRRAAVTTAARRPWRHIVIAVADESRDPYGLCEADWDMLTRVPGLERLDVVVTDATLAGAWHERVHELLPGIEEVRVVPAERGAPAMAVPSREHPHVHGAATPRGRIWESRDREDEVARFASWVRARCHADDTLSLDRFALVVRQPLPYVYLAREVLRSANVDCQTFETVPLAAEPYAAALDLVFSAVSTNFSRPSAIALLSSPHFRFLVDDGLVSPRSVATADVVLSEQGFLGGVEHLDRIVEGMSGDEAKAQLNHARPALRAMREIARELEAMREARPAAEHLDTLLSFLTRHRGPVTDAAAVVVRERRARAAVLGVLAVLARVYRDLDASPIDFGRLVLIIRRHIEAQTFAPHTGFGVYVVDADSARFGDFDHVQLAGVVEGEWPRRVQGSIFYSAALLRELGWSAESAHLDHARASFRDLLTLPVETLRVSTFNLEDDGVVSPSPLLDEIERVAHVVEEPAYRARVHEVDVLGKEPVHTAGLDAQAVAWAELRLSRPEDPDRRFQGRTTGHRASTFSLSALERYQDCAFTYFAHDVLRLSDVPEDEPFLSPRARGKFVHDVFHRFFAAWDARGGSRDISVDTMEEARQVFVEVAGPLLDALGDSDRALEHARLFGSAIGVGMIDVVLQIEATRPHGVLERWLETEIAGDFSLGGRGGRRAPIRGIVDRVDLLDGHRLRVIDYKTGRAPAPARALQAPVYALCVQEQVARRDGHDWTIEDAAYVTFSGKKSLVSVFAGGNEAESVLDAARTRVFDLIEGIETGEFGPRPHDVKLCRVCPYPAVCRQDYVDEP